MPDKIIISGNDLEKNSPPADTPLTIVFHDPMEAPPPRLLSGWLRALRRTARSPWSWALTGLLLLALAGALARWKRSASQVLPASPEASEGARPDGPPASNWRNLLARKARKGVVVISAERHRWYRWNDTSVGTGVVIAKAGHRALLLTNRHVIEGTNAGQGTLEIFTQDHAALPAQLAAVPSDPEIDLALLIVPGAETLAVMGDLQDFASLQAGDEVVAIGHPLELEFTMTNGIISALRDHLYIQNSAPINPGSSGGPLLNQSGRIVGISTAIRKDSQGLFFALRADYVLRPSAWTYFRKIDDLLQSIHLQNSR